MGAVAALEVAGDGGGVDREPGAGAAIVGEREERGDFGELGGEAELDVGLPLAEVGDGGGEASR